MPLKAQFHGSCIDKSDYESNDELLIITLLICHVFHVDDSYKLSLTFIRFKIPSTYYTFCKPPNGAKVSNDERLGKAVLLEKATTTARQVFAHALKDKTK